MLEVTYGQAIKAYRKRRGISQSALAIELGMPADGTISKWERNVLRPGPERLERLRAMGVEIPAGQEPRTLTQRIGALEYAVSELIDALREGGGGATPRSAEALENATAALAAAAPALQHPPRRAPRRARRDQ